MIKNCVWRLLSAFIALLCAVTVFSVPASAADNFQQSQQFNREQDIDEVYVDIITVPQGATFEEKIEALREHQQENLNRNVEVGLANVGIIRSGNTADCDVIFNWVGYMIQAVRYKMISINSTSIFSEEPYDYLGDGYSYSERYFVAAPKLRCELGRVQIPTSVTRVKLVCNSVQVLAADNAPQWWSVAMSGNAIEID